MYPPGSVVCAVAAGRRSSANMQLPSACDAQSGHGFIHIKQCTAFCVVLHRHPSAKNKAAREGKRDEESEEQNSLDAGREQSRREQHLVVVTADLDGQEFARMGGVDEVLQNNICKRDSVGLTGILCQGVATEEQRGSCHGPGHASTRLTGHTADPC